MQRRQRAFMPGVHGRQHVKSFGPPALADDNAVGPHAQRIAHQLADIDMPSALLVGGPRLQCHQVIMVQPQLGRVFDGDDPLTVRNLV
ncbi:hypothetical protein D3C71_1433480 [compost metagenome]